MIIGRPTPPGGCNHNLGHLETRPGYLNHRIIWEQSYFEKCPQCHYCLLPLQHCQICKQCFRIPQLHNQLTIPDRDVDVCGVCQFCILVRHALLAAMGGRNEQSLPIKIYRDFARMVREMWVQDLRDNFYFGNDDLAPFHFRYYNKLWTVWLLSSPCTTGGFRNYMPLFVKCYSQCLRRMAMGNPNFQDNPKNQDHHP